MGFVKGRGFQRENIAEAEKKKAESSRGSTISCSSWKVTSITILMTHKMGGLGLLRKQRRPREATCPSSHSTSVGQKELDYRHSHLSSVFSPWHHNALSV